MSKEMKDVNKAPQPSSVSVKSNTPIHARGKAESRAKERKKKDVKGLPNPVSQSPSRFSDAMAPNIFLMWSVV